MTETIGVLSTLEGDLQAGVKRWWQVFEEQYQSTGVQTFDYPNVTFQGGRCGDVPALRAALAALVPTLAPSEIVIDGFGCFEAARVIFLRVELTAVLRQIHAPIHDLLVRHCDEVFAHYTPEQWQPHVTLAMDDLTPDNFERAWRDLSASHPRDRQTLSNLCLVQVDAGTGHIHIIERWALSTQPDRPTT